MKLQFLGATRQVTGSKYYLEAGGAKILIDCGMFQEREYRDRNWEPSPVPARRVDALLLTHAHLDHCGLTPRLVKEGFGGPIFATAASADLVDVILRDSAEIQMEDAAYKKRRHQKEGRSGRHPEVPLYTTADVERALPLVKIVRYGQEIKIDGEVRVTFHDAGHILGSAVVEITVGRGEQLRRLLFSGDLGQWDRPILRDPTLFHEADFVVMESTYGDRDHDRRESIESQLGRVIRETVGRGGNVVIPAFAVERAQELMFYISRLVRAEEIPNVPVFLDSPMAIDVTDVFLRHRECFDEETWQMISSGEPPLRFPGLSMVRSVEGSKAINKLRDPAIIMAGSGMCNAGRIKHHLRQNITRPESTILFVGYQVRGTLGRQILEGNPEVRIHGRPWPVRAQVEEIHGFSGHADRTALLRWLASFQTPPRRLFLTHGEEEGALSLADRVRSQMGWQVDVPEYQQEVDLG
ncbi:MAG: MBL fold hydrolase [Planctomycetes bacterium RBG_16_64_12]|nr:MAG: MBL fold hydrolase [Planctomycetes bacterium RBG_16_64_12]